MKIVSVLATESQNARDRGDLDREETVDQQRRGESAESQFEIGVKISREAKLWKEAEHSEPNGAERLMVAAIKIISTSKARSA